jgi:aminomethyltransferase
VLDDLFTYRLGADRFLTVTNASNHEKDLGWFREHAGDLDAEVADAHQRWAMLAVQGPAAREAVERVAEGGLPARMRTAEVKVAGADCLACGTGYTGEDGVELLIPSDGAPAVWDALLEQGVVPAGLGARDTLRLEVCFHLYGNDLSEDRNPIEAGLAWCCKLDTGFIGADALRGIEPEQTLVPFAFTGAGIPRQGNPVHTQDGEGVVTSGSLSPCLEVGIGMAYVPLAAAEPGTELEVDVRGKPRAAQVREKPLYRKETSG